MGQNTPHFSQLSIAERVELVGDIWDSIAAENAASLMLSESQRQEIQRRLTAHDADSGSAIAWEQARAQVFPPSH